MVRKVGDGIEMHFRPHDLRRHAATFASLSSVPIEIVSKVILGMPTYRPHSGTSTRSVIRRQ